MNICIYGASSNLIDKGYIDATEELGYLLAKRGHKLIFGAGAGGLMGAAARGFYRAGGSILGIVPSFFNVDGVLFEDCDELIYTETMRERKQLMEKRADAFIAVPGGIGTFDEMFEILTLKQLGIHNKPTVFFNTNGYYNTLLSFLEFSKNQEFMTENTLSMAPLIDSPEELADYIESYKPQEHDFSVMKNVDNR